MKRFIITVSVLLSVFIEGISSPGFPIVYISGSNSAVVCPDVSYLANSSKYISNPLLTFTGSATYSSPSFSRTGNNITITFQWLTAGTNTITIYDGDDPSTISDPFTVTITMPSAPSAPDATLISTLNCGVDNVMSYSNSLPTNVNWYWQTSSSGTSTANGTSSYTVTSTTNLWLRSRRAVCPFDWGGVQSFGSFSVPSPPTAPSASAVTAFTATPVTLSVAPVSGITTYHWFTASTGGAPISGATENTYDIVTSSATHYYVVSFDGTCESSRTAVTVNIEPSPVIIVVGGGAAEVSFGSELSLTTTTSYDTVAWTSNGGAIIDSTASCTIHRPGNYSVMVKKASVLGIGIGYILVHPGGGFPMDENYIITNKLTTPLTDSQDLPGLSFDNYIQQIIYFDGQARQKQLLNTQGSPTKYDLVTPISYDSAGRPDKTYLPFVSPENDGWFKKNALVNKSGIIPTDPIDQYHTGDQFGYYQVGGTIPVDSVPYARVIYEPSPLSRVLNHGAPGSTWQPVNAVSDPYSTDDKTIKSRFEFNTDSQVVLFAYDSISGRVSPGTTSTINYYAAGTLHLTRTLDEHNVESQEFKDKEDRVICKKVQYKTTSDVKQFIETYYIYDIIGNLVAVLPPEAVKMILN